MDVLNPASCRTGESTMTSNNEEPSSTPTAAVAQQEKATQRAHVTPRKPRVAPGKRKSEKKASTAHGRPKSQKAAKRAKSGAGARTGSKAAKVLELLKRPDGAS